MEGVAAPTDKKRATRARRDEYRMMGTEGFGTTTTTTMDKDNRPTDRPTNHKEAVVIQEHEGLRMAGGCWGLIEERVPTCICMALFLWVVPSWVLGLRGARDRYLLVVALSPLIWNPCLPSTVPLSPCSLHPPHAPI